MRKSNVQQKFICFVYFCPYDLCKSDSKNKLVIDDRLLPSDTFTLLETI